MKKVKHTLVTFLHSFVPHDIYYPKLLHTRFQLSIKYYLIVISFFTILFTGIVLYRYSPTRMLSYAKSVADSLSQFPEGAKITVKNGILESNQNKPLFLWVYHDHQPLFVFMVHTKDTLASSHIPLPLIFLGSDKAWFSYRGNSFVHTYDSSWNILITKERVQSAIASINASFPFFLLMFYLLLIVFVPILFITFTTSFIFLSSVLVLVLLHTFIPHIHLKKCIQASIHGTHIPFFIVILLFSLFPSAINILIIAASCFFVFTLVSTYEMYSKEIAHKP